MIGLLVELRCTILGELGFCLIKIISWIILMITTKLWAGLVPLPPFLIFWPFRNPSLALASSNFIFGSMIGYVIIPNVVCFGMPFQEVPRFSAKLIFTYSNFSLFCVIFRDLSIPCSIMI